MNNSYFTVGLGGGHEIAWGSYQGLYKSALNRSQRRIDIINLDAHFDLRKPTPLTSSGTPFVKYQACQQRQPFHYCCLGIAETANTAALFDFAEYSNTQFLLDYECRFAAATDQLTNF